MRSFFFPLFFPNSLFILLSRSFRLLLLLFLLFPLLCHSFPQASAQSKALSALNDAGQRKIEINVKRNQIQNLNLKVTENNGRRVVGSGFHSMTKRNVGLTTTSTTTPAARAEASVDEFSDISNKTYDIDEEDLWGDEETRRSRRSKEEILSRRTVALEYDKVFPFVLAYVSTLQFQVVHIYTNKDTPTASVARLLLRLNREGVSVHIQPENASLTSPLGFDAPRTVSPEYETSPLKKTLHLADVDHFPLGLVAQASVWETWLLLVLDRERAEDLLWQLTTSVKMLIDNQVIFVNTPDAAEVFDASLRQRGRTQAPRTKEDAEADALFFAPRRTSRAEEKEDPPGGEVQEESSKLSDSKNLYKIYEVYSPSVTLPHRYLHLGSWRFEGGTVRSSFNDLENPLRRKDLTGLHLRCATINNFLPYVTIDRIGKEVRLRGWFADVYDSMREYFNFTTTCVETVDGEWGALRDGAWSGMVGMLTRNEADVIVAPLDHVTAREEVIDYTIGIAVIGYQLLIKRPDMSDSMWTAYILVFSDGVWVSLLVSLALSLVVLVASVNYSPFESRTRVSEIAMIPIYAVSQQGWFSDVTARSCRIAYITLYLTTTLSYAAYTSTLTSALATQRMTLPFVDMAGALRIGSYGIGFPKGFSVETAFRYATGGLYKDVWDKLIMSDPENLVPNDDAGIDRVLTKKYAFLAQDVYTRLENIVPRPCDYVVLPKDYFTLSTAMAVTTGSPYRRLFNAYLLKMKDSGMMDKFRRNHVSQYSDCEQTGARPLGIQNVFSGFMLVPFGVAIATVFLFVEFVYIRLSRTTINLKSSSSSEKQKEDLNAQGRTRSNFPFQLLEFLSGNQPSGM